MLNYGRDGYVISPIAAGAGGYGAISTVTGSPWSAGSSGTKPILLAPIVRLPSPAEMTDDEQPIADRVVITASDDHKIDTFVDHSLDGWFVLTGNGNSKGIFGWEEVGISGQDRGRPYII